VFMRLGPCRESKPLSREVVDKSMKVGLNLQDLLQLFIFV
jgi:hypothetical protein